MAYLDPYMQSLQDYIMQGDYGNVVRLLMQNRANEQTNNPMGYASDYSSQVGSRSGLLGTIFEVLTGMNPKAFEGNSNVDQFQNVFRSYFNQGQGGGQGTPSLENYQRQALQGLFSNSEGARSYYNSLFPGSGTAGQVDSAYQNIAQQVAALLSNRYSSTALQSMFGQSALNKMIDEFRMKQSANPTMNFLDYMYSLYGKYLPPVDRQKTPAATTPDTTNPQDEITPDKTPQRPMMPSNPVGSKNNPLIPRDEQQRTRQPKKVGFLGAY